MILDWKNDQEFALSNGVRKGNYGETIYFCGKSESSDENFLDRWDAINAHGIFKDIVFKNFPTLNLNNSTYENCTFENCGDVHADECEMIYCSFINTDFVMGDRTGFYGCNFSDSKAWVTFLSVDKECKVDGCTFKNISVKGFETHVCRMIGDKEKNIRYLTNCKFIDCTLENLECPISIYTYNSFFVKDKEIENIAESCEIIGEQAKQKERQEILKQSQQNKERWEEVSKETKNIFKIYTPCDTCGYKECKNKK